MSKLKIVYWFDIPGQVVAREGRRSRRYRLSAKFSRAIERASYRVKKQGEDGLFDPWHSVPQSYDGELSLAAQGLVARLEREYDDQRLDHLVRGSGRETPVLSVV
jgi:hypothetical protein